MGVRWSDWTRYLLPQQEEQDPALREEIARVSIIGLRAILWVCLAGPAFMLLVTTIQKELGLLSRVWLLPDLSIMAIGLTAIPFCRVSRLRRYARLAGCVIGYCVELVFVVTGVTTTFPGLEFVVPHNFTLVMLLELGALPLRPMQTLALGSSMLATYVGALILYPEKLFLPDISPLYLSSLVMITSIFVALTAIVYDQRASAFQAREQVLRAQARLALAEGAAAQGRLAAALSHELNSPIGIIGSNVQALASALRKYEAGQHTLEGFIDSVSSFEGLLDRATRRVSEVVSRMQRFTNLDRAEKRATDLSMLLKDTVDMLKGELQECLEIEMDLEELPAVHCSPQEMTAVFSNLLLNSKQAMVDKGTLRLATTFRDGEIVIEIEDDGPGIPGEKLHRIFEPSFAATQGRVSTANWGLFHCRTVINGLGGTIDLESAEGEGTKVTIVLPGFASRMPGH